MPFKRDSRNLSVVFKSAARDAAAWPLFSKPAWSPNEESGQARYSLLAQYFSRPHWAQRCGAASPQWQPPSLTQHAQSVDEAFHEQGQPDVDTVHRSTLAAATVTWC